MREACKTETWLAPQPVKMAACTRRSEPQRCLLFSRRVISRIGSFTWWIRIGRWFWEELQFADRELDLESDANNENYESGSDFVPDAEENESFDSGSSVVGPGSNNKLPRIAVSQKQLARGRGQAARTKRAQGRSSGRGCGRERNAPFCYSSFIVFFYFYVLFLFCAVNILFYVLFLYTSLHWRYESEWKLNLDWFWVIFILLIFNFFNFFNF